MRTRIGSSLSFAAAVALAACGGGESGNVTRPVVQTPVTVSIFPATVTLGVGASVVLAVSIASGKATPSPSLASCTSTVASIVTASASNGNCAVTGVGPGTTTVNATSSTGQQASASVTITASLEALTGLSLASSSLPLSVGQTRALTTLTETGGAGVIVSLAYASNDASIASVDAQGLITAVSAGTALITATATGSGAGFATSQRAATATITVMPYAVTSLSVQASATTLPPTQTAQLTATIATAHVGVNVNTSYTSNAPVVAAVSSTGLVTGRSAGAAVITVRASGSGVGVTANALVDSVWIKVTDVPAITSLTVSASRTSVPVAQTAQLTPTVTTAHPVVSVSTTYESSLPAVAAVSAAGLVTGVAPGTAVVTVRASGSGGGFTPTDRSASVTITVTALPNALTGLAVSVSRTSIFVAQTAQVTATATTAGSDVSVITTYESSAPAVAIVSASGLVTGVAVGSTILTVHASGSGEGFTPSVRSASLTITVTALPNALTALTVSASRTSMPITQAAQLTATVTTAGAGVDVSTTYVSSVPGVATVSASGLVSGMAPGSTTIRVRASGSGAGFTPTVRLDSVTITVTALPNALADLVLSPGSATLPSGQWVTLVTQATTAGQGVTVRFTFVSSNIAVATVDSAGRVTAAAPSTASITGTTTITVTATGSGAGYTTNQLTRQAIITTTNLFSLGVGYSLQQFSSIPEGRYRRGAANGEPNEQPVRTISISAFRMQLTEVTQGQWRQVMAGTALAGPRYFTPCGDLCPVEQASWSEIQQFITRLNQQDPGKGYRLPTEAEWEYAARAGTTGDFNVDGQTAAALGWINGAALAPVAQKIPNAFGLFDTHGNTFEWVADWYGDAYYASSPSLNPIGPASGATRVLRGGNVLTPQYFARSAFRLDLPPSATGHGFRLARVP